MNYYLYHLYTDLIIMLVTFGLERLLRNISQKLQMIPQNTANPNPQNMSAGQTQSTTGGLNILFPPPPPPRLQKFQTSQAPHPFPCLQTAQPKEPPMPLEFQSKGPPSPLEFPDATHNMVEIFSGITHCKMQDLQTTLIAMP